MAALPRVYFDTCALNRSFDDQSQARIRLEAEAVEHLIGAVGERRLEWVSSDVVVFEVTKNPDEELREILLTIVRCAGLTVAFSNEIARRARALREQGMRAMDALHLASAEAGGAQVLITTDDQFLRAASRLESASAVQVKNPVAYEMEIVQ